MQIAGRGSATPNHFVNEGRIKIESLSQVVAKRIVSFEQGDGSHGDLIVRMPQLFPEAPEDYYEPHEIVGSGIERSFYVCGVDSVQALQLTMEMIGSEVQALSSTRQAKISSIEESGVLETGWKLLDRCGKRPS